MMISGLLNHVKLLNLKNLKQNTHQQKNLIQNQLNLLQSNQFQLNQNLLHNQLTMHLKTF